MEKEEKLKYYKAGYTKGFMSAFTFIKAAYAVRCKRVVQDYLENIEDVEICKDKVKVRFKDEPKEESLLSKNEN